MGSAKSFAERSRSGALLGNSLLIAMAVKQMSMAPAFAATASTYFSSLLVKGIDLRCLGDSAAADDVGCNRFYIGKVPSTQKELRAFASECARDGVADVSS